MGRRDDQEEDDVDKAPRLYRAIQPCQLRRAAPSRSLAPAGAPKAAGAAANEI